MIILSTRHKRSIQIHGSTSCAVTRHGKHLINMIRVTQRVMVLGSVESDHHSLVRLSHACIASAANGVASRCVAGKVSHVETASLWLQTHVTDRRVGLQRASSKTTVADLEAITC